MNNTESFFTLAQIQNWFLQVISHPEGVRAENAATDSLNGLPMDEENVTALLTASHRLSPWERIGIYSHAYFARLLECMQEEFPVLRHTVGYDLFNEFTLRYLQEHPPKSYSLFHLGSQFPRFLHEMRPERVSSSEFDWADFIIDLADYELQLNEVFDGPGIERSLPIDSTQFSKKHPYELPALRFTPVPCLRLVEYRFPVHRYFAAIRNSQACEPPAALTTYLAISRRNFRVEHYELCRPAWMLLSMLISGATLGESIEFLLHGETDQPELESWLFEWFRDWSAMGIFANCE